ncbi:MAG: hypothetical protein ACRBBS_09640 [Thalassovita sp.]
MGIGLTRAAKISWHWRKLSKLYNAHEYEEALSLLGTLELPLEYQAKAQLKRADIQHRNGDLRAAISSYEGFITSDKLDALKEADLAYLRSYAIFFQDNAIRKLEPQHPISITLSRLRDLYASASRVTRAEFVAP